MAIANMSTETQKLSAADCIWPSHALLIAIRIDSSINQAISAIESRYHDGDAGTTRFRGCAEARRAQFGRNCVEG